MSKNVKSKQQALAAVRRALEQAMKGDYSGRISPDADLVADLGLDSLQIATFLIAVEDECGVVLPEEIESRPITINALADRVIGLSR